MRIDKVGSLLSKLLLAFLAFPPIYIVVKYLRWCSKQEKSSSAEESEEN
ncbi:MAG: hypothetical protein K2X27_06635 [Candidatus Obscuribacterales bacterium]|nr:hypothetical protein [Candidatus Obscuribacterales bacterium]